MKQLSGLIDRVTWGKLLYGVLFCVIIPAYLAFWATRLEFLSLPAVPDAPSVGLVLLGLGITFMVSGITALWVHGGGLPMNAYPPSRFVRQGIYRWMSEPIYIGFVLGCFGVSIALNSPAGLWVVSPVAGLACAALVYGYERPDLVRRFGGQYAPPWLRLPPSDMETPTLQDIVSVVVLVFGPWLILYETVELIGVVPPVLHSTLPFEEGLPVWGFSTIVYMIIYPLVVLAPLVAQQRDHLHDFALGGLIATAIIIPFYLTIPIIAEFREVSADAAFSKLLLWQQQFDRPVTALPAFHIVWLLLAIRLYGQAYPSARFLFWTVGLLIFASCWTTGMHALLDLFAGMAVYAVVSKRNEIWKYVLHGSELVANSWKEWRFGQTRVINHGLYAGLAAAVGFLIVGFISGPSMFWTIAIIGISTLLGAGIWGQILVGSQKLLRPFGYYGGVLGAAVGLAFASLVLSQDVLPIAAALSVAAPWVQAIGRFRCLIQGCCHGAPTFEGNGIHYRHKRSRVLQIAGLGGKPLYPTPVFSMVSNLVVGLLTLRLLLIDAPATFIVGTYLMLNGLARFVEEAYRGEPQTQVFGGLKVYQWTALCSFLVGTAFTMFPSAAVGTQHFGLTPIVWLGSVALGALVTIAMGVDWPESSRRFSRLI